MANGIFKSTDLNNLQRDVLAQLPDNESVANQTTRVRFLSMPVKSAIGVAMLVIDLPYIMDMLMYTKEGEILGPVKKVIAPAN